MNIPREPSDFRPISILCYFSKILEKLIENQISFYLSSNNLLHTFQSGFRAKHSCDSALLKITTDIRESLDANHVVSLVLLDFTKAFDSVSHCLLLRKLVEKFSFSRSAVKLVSSFLSNRFQQVKVDSIYSEYLPVLSGVPQGSILGPLLFSLFINDLPDVILYCLLHLYADDVQLYLSRPIGLVEDCISRLNEDLERIYDWSKKNNLILNPKKSQSILFYRNRIEVNSMPEVILGNNVVPYVSHVRNLGIMLNSQMSCCDHVNFKLQKIYSGLRKLWLYADVLSSEMRIKLVKSLLVPHFTHGNIVFPNLDCFCRRKMEVAYNDCVRFVFSLRRFDHISDFRFKVLDRSIRSYLLCQALVHLHSLYYGGSPNYLFLFLNKMKSDRHICFKLPSFNYSIMKSSYFVYVIRFWNSLPAVVQRTRSKDTFKKLINLHIDRDL